MARATWGQVLGTGSRLSWEAEGSSRRDAPGRRKSELAGKTPWGAAFQHRATAVRILHGKEGVSGSSPEEGLKYLQIGVFCCPI
jgi:hypothetical protein